MLVAVRLLGVEGAEEACGQREEALVRHLHVAFSDVQRLDQHSRAKLQILQRHLPDKQLITNSLIFTNKRIQTKERITVILLPDKKIHC